MNRRLLLIIAAAVMGLAILAGYGLLIQRIILEQQEQEAIMMQLEPLEAAVNGGNPREDVIPTRQAELSTLEAELATLQQAFPSETNSSQVLRSVIQRSEEYDIVLRQITAREPVTETAGEEVTYRVFAYDVTIEGPLSATQSFIHALESEDIETLTVDEIHVQAQPESGDYQTSMVMRVYLRQ